jgi:excisionase family DNA binding protein
MSSNIVFNKKCEHCGKEFTAKTLYTRYCSHDCNSAHYKLLKRQEKINNFKEEQSKPIENLLPFNSIIQQKDFLSIEETAALLGASRRTLFRLISNGSLKVGKIGRRTIIKRKEIDKLFK